MKSGILNSVIVGQVRNTAAWLWAMPACGALARIFDAAVDEPLEEPGALERALRVRFAAHYATVATFVPTDVDAHIRHHMWMLVGDAETFARAKACVDEAVGREPSAVSARVTSRRSSSSRPLRSVMSEKTMTLRPRLVGVTSRRSQRW